MSSALWTIVVATSATIIAMPPTIRLLKSISVLDSPNQRSSHDRPTLRGGGIATLFGILLALGAAPIHAELPTTTFLAFALLPLAVGFVGLIDDISVLSVLPRLVAQLLLSCLGAWAVLAETSLHGIGALMIVVAGCLWIAAFVNAFNFMDGINGISSVTAITVGLSYIAVGRELDDQVLLVCSASLLGTAVAFLPYNFPRAIVFLGDVGSYSFGALIALLALRSVIQGASIPAVLGPLLIYLVDTSSALTRRVFKGEAWWQPHRSHVYQRLANGRLRHTRTTAIVGGFMVLSAALGIAIDDESVVQVIVASVIGISIATLYLCLPRLIDPQSIHE